MPNIPQSELPKPKSWDEFEDICWDLYTGFWEDPHADRYGRGGQPQHGVDIFGRPKHLEGGCAGVQCKRYDEGKLTRALIKREVTEADRFTPTLSEYIIATTDPRAVDLQSFVLELSQEREEAGRFPVHLAFWDTLCGLLTNPDYKDILLKHYGEWVTLALRASASAALILPLPADLADFTGRQAQIQRVRDLLNQQSIVTISGMGGMGKTALAVHVAHQLVAEGRFTDAQLYIDLKGVDPDPVHPADALQSLLNALLEPDPNRPRDLDTLSALWRAAIQGQDALLILDNAADANQVRPLLPGCPTCAVLVTSRQRFTLPGAQRLDLRPMPLAEARQLLQELAPHLDADGADRMAGLCGRLPQALRIAGNYLNLNDDVTPDQYAGMLSDERTRLAQLRDPDDPDLDVAAAISLSVAQLDRDTRRAWALLSLFPAPFDLPAAAALWDQPQDPARTRLQALRNRSLVTYDPDAQRYLQHDLVRLAAADDLQALTGEEARAARLRFARHYEQIAREANRLYMQGGDEALQGLALLDREWPHIQAGQAWAEARADHDDEAARLCSAYPDAARILFLRLYPGNLVDWLEPALKAARRVNDQSAEASHLNNLANAYTEIAEWDRAIELYEQALDTMERAGDVHGMAGTYNNLGRVYEDKGEWDRAIEFYKQSLETKERVGDIRGMASTYTNLGEAYRRKGEWNRAIAFCKQALEICEQVGDIHGIAMIYVNLGSVNLQKGEWDRAIEVYEQGLSTLEQVGDIRSIARTYVNLGSAYLQKGKWDRAIESYEQGLSTLERVGDRHGAAKTLWGLGLVYSRLGEVHRAREKYQQSLATLEALGAPEAETVRSLLADLEN